MAGGLQRISFIRLIREEERSDGRREGEKKDRRSVWGGVESSQVNTPQAPFDPNI